MKILLAVDGSVPSGVAVAEVAKRPWPAEAEVRVVHVEPATDPVLLRGPRTMFDELMREHRMESLKHLQDAVEVLVQGAPGLRVSSALLKGSPKDALIAEVESWGADLIVVGSHGHGPIRRFFLGSTSQYVANNAPCSVEIVRPRTVPESDAGTEVGGPRSSG